MTRRVKTKKDRKLEVLSRVENDDGTVTMGVRVKNRPGRRKGGPAWNGLPYPESIRAIPKYLAKDEEAMGKIMAEGMTRAKAAQAEERERIARDSED
jgi:hypothetical protein